MSGKFDSTSDLLGLYAGGEKRQVYLRFVSSLHGDSVGVLYDKLLRQKNSSWQWWAVMDAIRLALANLTNWDEVILLRSCLSIQPLVDDQLRQVVAKQSIGWLMDFLDLSTTAWVSEFLCEELRRRIDAISMFEPLPEWFIKALSVARKKESQYFGLLEQRVMKLVCTSRFVNILG